MNLTRLRLYWRWDILLGLLSAVIALGAVLFSAFGPHTLNGVVAPLAVVLDAAICFYLLGYQIGYRNAARQVNPMR